MSNDASVIVRYGPAVSLYGSGRLLDEESDPGLGPLSCSSSGEGWATSSPVAAESAVALTRGDLAAAFLEDPELEDIWVEMLKAVGCWKV